MPTFCTACAGEFRRRSDGSCGNPLCSRYRKSGKGEGGCKHTCENLVTIVVGEVPVRLSGVPGGGRGRKYVLKTPGANFAKCRIGGPPKRLKGKHADWRVIKRLGFKRSLEMWIAAGHIVCKRTVMAARAAQAQSEADKLAAAAAAELAAKAAAEAEKLAAISAAELAAQAEADKRVAAENRVQALESRAKGLLAFKFLFKLLPDPIFFLIVLVRES